MLDMRRWIDIRPEPVSAQRQPSKTQNICRPITFIQCLSYVEDVWQMFFFCVYWERLVIAGLRYKIIKYLGLSLRLNLLTLYPLSYLLQMFHHLEVMACCRDAQLQMGENYSLT